MKMLVYSYALAGFAAFASFALVGTHPVLTAESDAPRKADVKVGDCFDVVLAENFSTGYIVNLQETLPVGIKFLSKETEAPNPGGGVGASQKSTWHFKVTDSASAGERKLKFFETPPGEKEPVKTYTFTITVIKPS